MATRSDLVHEIYSVLLPIMHARCTIALITFSQVNKFFHRKVASYARENSIRRQIKPADLATMGYLKLLKEAAKYGKQINYYDVSSIAALYGHLHILKWIKTCDNQVIKLNSDICNYGALRGHIHILDWAWLHVDKWNDG